MEVIKQVDDLNRHVYTFVYIDNFTSGTIYLNTYSFEARETTRHKYKKIKHYNRLSVRESNIIESDIILTDDIKAEALQQFVDKIMVKKWSER